VGAGDLTGSCLDAADGSTRGQKSVERRVLENDGAEASSRIGVSEGHFVRAGEPIAGTEGRAAEIIGAKPGHHRTRLRRSELDYVLHAQPALEPNVIGEALPLIIGRQ